MWWMDVVTGHGGWTFFECPFSAHCQTLKQNEYKENKHKTKKLPCDDAYRPPFQLVKSCSLPDIWPLRAGAQIVTSLDAYMRLEYLHPPGV